MGPPQKAAVSEGARAALGGRWGLTSGAGGCTGGSGSVWVGVRGRVGSGSGSAWLGGPQPHGLGRGLQLRGVRLSWPLCLDFALQPFPLHVSLEKDMGFRVVDVDTP